MAEIVDARGLSCPQPVILTKKALAQSDEIITIVDNEVASVNVSRMVQKAGGNVDVEEKEDGIYLHITKGGEQPASVGCTSAPSGLLVLTVPGDAMGRGSDELGGILVRGFFHTLGEVEPLPDTVIFFNRGVKLVIEGSPVLEDLLALQDRGVRILACGTCLDYFDLKDKVGVGQISNMYTIAETLLSAGKVVPL